MKLLLSGVVMFWMAYGLFTDNLIRVLSAIVFLLGLNVLVAVLRES